MKNVFKLTIGIVLLTLVFSSLGWSQSTADIVLIIDSSGSMVENDPNDLRKAAARQLIDLADSDVQIGIVDFDSDAVTLKELTSANKDGKSELKNAVGRIDAYDGTNIAAGLQQGFDVLSKSKTFTARKAAVLLTDGEDNEPTTLDAYVGNYVKEGWSVYTIGLDDGVSLDRALLEAIAAETLEGEYYSVTVDNIQSVYHKILAKITWKSVVLASPSGYINQDQTIEKRVKIDGWVTQANFTLNWTGSTVEMVLVDPSGAEITPDTAATLGISYQAAPTYAIYTVDNPMQGEWKMRLTGTDIPPEGEAYGIVVTGASDFITNLLAFEPSYAIGDTVRIGIRIEEKTGDTAHPIIGATTSATVVRPDGRIETINLFDDGVHNDNAAGDGIYAGNYTNVDILGTYLIRVSVQNGFSREIQQQIIVGDIDNVFVDGSTLIPAAGATLNRAPRSISAVISGPARKIDSESIVLKIDGKVVAHTYDVVNQLVSFQPTRLSRGTHTVSLSVNNTIETNWSFITASGVASRFDTLMVLLNEELNTLEETDLAQNYTTPYNP
ncbi:MAG: VWA domain-containing protein [Candidatus Poribacteria bacterium]|nr:VWA domain-containing protein [Candidatus Poribacteria bacterium]